MSYSWKPVIFGCDSSAIGFLCLYTTIWEILRSLLKIWSDLSDLPDKSDILPLRFLCVPLRPSASSAVKFFASLRLCGFALNSLVAAMPRYVLCVSVVSLTFFA